MIFTNLSLILLAVLLLQNYAKDKGSHTRAKVVHAMALAFAVVLGALSFGVVFSQVQHFAPFSEYYSRTVGLVPGRINLAAAVLVPICEMLLYLLAFAATKRNATVVKVFRVVLLASIPPIVVCVYVNSNTSPAAHSGLLIAACVVVALKLGLFFFYGSRSVKEFLSLREGVADDRPTPLQT